MQHALLHPGNKPHFYLIYTDKTTSGFCRKVINIPYTGTNGPFVSLRTFFVAVHGFWKMENFQSPKMPKLLILSVDLKF